jgi:hypothetical protein
VPLEGDKRQLGALAQSMRDLATGAPIARELEREVKSLLKEEFAAGVGPYGDWQETKRGKQALLSRKLPQAFKSEFQPNGLRFSAKTSRDLLVGHQEGHTFPARQVAANKQFLTFKNGKLVKLSRALNKRGEVRRGVHQTFAREHTVGERVLPARPIVPRDSEGMPSTWQNACTRGAERGMQRWFEQAVK